MPEVESVRSISTPVLHHVGYSFIYLGKFAMGSFCLIGVVAMWRARGSAADQFNRAKLVVISGSGIGLFMLFFGFFVIAGAYFNPGGTDGIYLAFHQFATFFMVGIGVVTWFISMNDLEI